jgi:hypothetical protein
MSGSGVGGIAELSPQMGDVFDVRLPCERRADRHAVCAEQPVDGAQEAQGTGWTSASANGQCSLIECQSAIDSGSLVRPEEEINLQLELPNAAQHLTCWKCVAQTFPNKFDGTNRPIRP